MSAKALSREQREKMFDCCERIIPEEIDKEVWEVAIARLIMERRMRDLEDERRQREDRLRLERMVMGGRIGGGRNGGDQRRPDIESDWSMWRKMLEQAEKEEDMKEGVTEQEELELVGLDMEAEVEQDEKTKEDAESTGT